ncbi:unnamed protein product [Nippostrongylus brasiliensis]|uniref:Ovule protein n=1 Tax=Nippostrongylus brasiliensis TaxID=27835 RepID=A0A0N4XL58_NIPBR|nr:unnamed protein product [Nippostrongylus brasiliensis]
MHYFMSSQTKGPENSFRTSSRKSSYHSLLRVQSMVNENATLWCCSMKTSSTGTMNIHHKWAKRPHT